MVAERGIYDPTTKKYATEGAYKLTFTAVRQRTVTHITGPDTRIVEVNVSFNEHPEWRSLLMKYTRRK